MTHRTMTARRLAPGLGVAAVLVCGAVVSSMVNPQLQPGHLAERHKVVIGGEITTVDADKGLVTFRVTHVCAGQFAPKEVTIQVASSKDGAKDDQPDAQPGGAHSLLDDADKGGAIVAYVGKKRQGHERDVLLYAGRQWHEAEVIDPGDTSKWKWSQGLGDKMYGTFNGSAERLLDLVIDTAGGRAFFPPTPFVKFKDDIVIDRLPGPIRGVALYDIDGDGKLDIYACSEKGDRAYLQTGPLKFEDRTKALHLEGVKSGSVSFADVDAEGRADLLADGAILLQTDKGFAGSQLLPTEAGRSVKCSAFVDVNGDGCPDVVISREKGGLALYLNPGAKGGAFIDATSASGLDKPENGAGLTGFFAPGDWNGDGRMDLYYAAGKGYILVQNEKGVFSAAAHKVNFDYKVKEGRAGLTGAGGFAPLWRADSWDIVSAGDMHLTIVTSKDGVPADVTRFGNETQQCKVSQLGTLAEDLNMDGYVDLLTITRQADSENAFHSNRGYGSFMVDDNYAKYDAFPGKSYRIGAGGAAAGDADGDGANDLLLGGVDGGLRLAVNDTLSLRKVEENSTYHEKKLADSRILTVKVAGRLGVLGATITLADASRRVVARRCIGSQVLTGCCGPNAVNLVVRESGKYVLTVRFSDGQTRAWPVDLTGTEKHVTFEASREQARLPTARLPIGGGQAPATRP